jgi:hypothetical protein
MHHKIYTGVTGTDISTSLLLQHKFCTAVTDTDISTFLLQHKVYQQAVSVPEELKDIINEETYNKARVYGLDNSSFSIVKELFSITLNVVRHYLIELCRTEISKTE